MNAALWLMERLGVPSIQIGDLLEQYGAGRSRGWLCRQALWMALVFAVNDIRRHKLLAVRALAVGFSSLLVLARIESRMLSAFQASVSGAVWIGGRVLQVGWVPPLNWIFLFSGIVITGVTSGWLVGFFHRGHRFSMTSFFALVFLLWQGATVLSRPGMMSLLTASILMGGLASGITTRAGIQSRSIPR
jgi:hypothetical protein